MYLFKDAPRKTFQRDEQTEELVADIIDNVRTKGDAELLTLTQTFDDVVMDSVHITAEQVRAAYEQVPPAAISAIQTAAAQIRFFAEKQLECIKPLTTATPIPGVTLGHRLVPVETVGAYVPAGRYPLPSSALMLAIPAKVAGVKTVVACSPVSKGYDTIHPAVLVAMDIAGVDEIYCTGGAQAIAAMAFGTQSVRKVDLIAGPGNRFVVEAKRQVIGSVGIDSLAGPSEVLILADEYANPDFAAADLLAQSEHDLNARSTLVTTSSDFAQRVLDSMAKQATALPTGEAAMQSWHDNGMIVIAGSLEEAIAYSNDVAPEHLEVHTHNAESVAAQLTNYGSLFIGEYTPVAFGDYCSGTNHTLPTMATAKYSNGVWVGTFLKTSFTQHISKQGCQNLAETCMTLAETEGLMAHHNSVHVRLES